MAGASTALLLARAGLRVLCVDRARYGSDTLSTHALMRAGTLQLQRWGLLDAIVAAGTPAVRRTVFHYGRDAVSVSIRPAAGVDALYAPRRTLLDAVIVDAAVEAGAVVRFGTAVTGLLRDPHGRRHRGGHPGPRRLRPRRDRPGWSSAPTAGTRWSPTRSARRSRCPGGAATAFVYGYWAGLAVDGYEWFYEPGFSAGAIPTNDGLTCVFVGTTAARAGPPRRRRRDRPTRFAGWPTGARSRRCWPPRERVGGLRYARGLPGYLRRSWGTGWALVGDAGYWKDPLSTHGMTDALRDAELLARAVLAAPRPRAGPARRPWPGTRPSATSWRRPMLSVTERIASHEWDLAEVRRLLMALASAMTDELELIGSIPVAG